MIANLKNPAHAQKHAHHDEQGAPVADHERTAALAVEGMTCMGCVANVTRTVKRVAGVSDVDVNLPRGRARIAYDPDKTQPSALAAALSAAGYPSHVEEGEDLSAQQAAEAQRQMHAHHHGGAWKRRALVGLVIWLPIETLHWTLYFLDEHAAHRGLNWMAWLSVVAGTFITFYVGRAFFRGAWNAARRGTTDMDTLIALGGGTAFVYSSIALAGYLLGWWAVLPELYFMEAAGLFTLIAIGHWLEGRARDQAGGAIRALLNLSPPTALRLPGGVEGGEPEIVPAAELAVGDLILVKPAMRIAADGVVESGASGVDESMLTGEPIPVRKQPGDEVIGGTLNTDGSLVVRITAAGSQTALAGIIRLVEQAQASKPPVQRLADRISAIFVPAVLVIALITLGGWLFAGYSNDWGAAATWGAAAKAVCSVLIIACPCALGLAVPAAIMVGTGRGARRGILLRDIDALQSAGKIDVIVFDKTGTLTTGKPQVVAIEPADGVSEEELLRLAASAEAQSEHPLAAAIVRRSRERGLALLPATEFRNEPGLGVEASIEGRALRVGHGQFAKRTLAARPTPSGHPGSEEQDALKAVATQVHVVEQDGAGERELGTIYLADQPKPDANQVVATLREMGTEVHLLTGDRRETAEAVARRVGIDLANVHADVRPGGKKEVVERLKAGGRRVAMVGDGINDAPALAAADLGIAVGGGTDAAKEAGGIVLVGDRLHDVVAAIRLSRATMSKIRQNLFFAFIYNVIAIPVAALGFLSPIVAAGAMAFSDVSVIGNALLLRRSKID